MIRRGEPVPFAFVAESERFRSNVAPPPRERPSGSQLAARVLATATVIAALVGAVMLGTPALEVPGASATGHQQADGARHH